MKDTIDRVSAKEDYLIDMLISLHMVLPGVVELARLVGDIQKIGVVELLVKHNLLSDKDLAVAKATHFGAEFVDDLQTTEISMETIAAVSSLIARKYRVVPLEKKNGALVLAITDPSDLATIDSLNHLLDVNDIVYKVASVPDVEMALEKYYPPWKLG